MKLVLQHTTGNPKSSINVENGVEKAKVCTQIGQWPLATSGTKPDKI